VGGAVAIGRVYGYGFEVALLASYVPRKAVVAYVLPGTPAAAAGITRGAQVLAVDGVDLVYDGSQAGVDVLNAGLFPTAPGSHSLTILDGGASQSRTLTLNAQALTLAPVQNVQVLPAPNQGVGYIQFNDHVGTAEQQLIDAVTQLKAGASAICAGPALQRRRLPRHRERAGLHGRRPAATAGQVFESLSFNDKNPFHVSEGLGSRRFTTRRKASLHPPGKHCPRSAEPRLRAHRSGHLLGERGDRQRPARHRLPGRDDRRHDLRQALWLLRHR